MTSVRAAERTTRIVQNPSLLPEPRVAHEESARDVLPHEHHADENPEREPDGESPQDLQAPRTISQGFRVEGEERLVRERVHALSILLCGELVAPVAARLDFQLYIDTDELRGDQMRSTTHVRSRRLPTWMSNFIPRKRGFHPAKMFFRPIAIARLPGDDKNPARSRPGSHPNAPHHPGEFSCKR